MKRKPGTGSRVSEANHAVRAHVSSRAVHRQGGSVARISRVLSKAGIDATATAVLDAVARGAALTMNAR